MANIRGFRDLNNQGGGNYNYMPMGQAAGNVNLPFFSNQPGDPRNEHFGSMLKNQMCPQLQLVSFTTFVAFILTILYISMLSVGGIYDIPYEQNPIAFLYVQPSTLKDFGGNDPYEVRNNGALYLWFTSLFLIPSFMTYVSTIIWLLIIYSPFERTQGFRNTIAIYFLGGASGSLFGNVCTCCTPQAFSEAYAPLYAVLGAYVALVILYWNKLEAFGPTRSYFACIIFMMVFFLIIFGIAPNDGFIDSYGNIGGLLGGIFLGMSIINVPGGGSYELKCRQFGLGFLAFYLGLDIILLFSLTY